jgi:hypothetical protein
MLRTTYLVLIAAPVQVNTITSGDTAGGLRLFRSADRATIEDTE